jgi:hypothetical protein
VVLCLHMLVRFVADLLAWLGFAHGSRRCMPTELGALVCATTMCSPASNTLSAAQAQGPHRDDVQARLRITRCGIRRFACGACQGMHPGLHAAGARSANVVDSRSCAGSFGTVRVTFSTCCSTWPWCWTTGGPLLPSAAAYHPTELLPVCAFHRC